MQFPDFNPVWFSIGPLDIRWYAIAYVLGIVLGWWYAARILKTERLWAPGKPPISTVQLDDLILWITLGIILGGRFGYALFYQPHLYGDIFTGANLGERLALFRLWDGGMSFHGGVIGTSIGLILFARKHKLDWLRVHDYIACVVPFGLFFGRLANFVNGELWGKPADVPWAIVFERTVPFDVPEPARHPSQLYEAGLEGLVLFAILWFAFWRTKARYQPGKLVGLFVLGYGVARFIVEFFREPDAQFRGTFIEATGIHMGQWLCVPMIAGGLYLILTAPGRRTRVEPIAGGESVA